uniref:Aldehyde dehydrogenase 8 family, member A1 n=1 Tax=Maylandia zebra TaxID=106582 RepID=A0A3P9DCG8_9CICH
FFSNTVVAKPSEMTSVTAWMLCKLMQQAGVPPGVVNIVFGSGPRAGDALVSHPEVPLVSFTGSTATAQRITERSAPYSIIFADADLDQCIETTVRSSFLNQVKTKCEVCLCTSRIYVERSIYSEFLERFVAAAKKWKTGVPLTPAAKMERSSVKNTWRRCLHVMQNVTKHLLFKFLMSDRNKSGYFMPTTVITGISDSSRVMQEEIFGPVTCISPFDTEDEAVARGNGVRYGLSATRLQAGLVWTNCWLVRDLNLPFGGMKNSGGEGRRKRFLSLLHRGEEYHYQALREESLFICRIQSQKCLERQI